MRLRRAASAVERAPADQATTTTSPERPQAAVITGKGTEPLVHLVNAQLALIGAEFVTAMAKPTIPFSALVFGSIDGHHVRLAFSTDPETGMCVVVLAGKETALPAASAAATFEEAIEGYSWDAAIKALAWLTKPRGKAVVPAGVFVGGSSSIWLCHPSADSAERSIERDVKMSRKYLDRQRRIPLDGRPVNPDWHQLPFCGMRAVNKGWAEESPYLSDVMFQGVTERVVFARPAAFFELLLEWLSINESDTCAYIRDQLGTLRAPRDSEEARSMRASPDCLAKRPESHRLRDAIAVYTDDDAKWAAGWCLDCMQALLWRFSDAGSAGGATWPFYDHRASAGSR